MWRRHGPGSASSPWATRERQYSTTSFKSVGDGESVKEKRERGQRGPSMTLGKLRALRGRAEYQRNRERRADPARSSGAAADAADQRDGMGSASPKVSIMRIPCHPVESSLLENGSGSAELRDMSAAIMIGWSGHARLHGELWMGAIDDPRRSSGRRTPCERAWARETRGILGTNCR